MPGIVDADQKIFARSGVYFSTDSWVYFGRQNSRVAEPEPAGAETFGRSQNIEVSAPAPGQLKYLKKI
jgi:hypothetical protein